MVRCGLGVQKWACKLSDPNLFAEFFIENTQQDVLLVTDCGTDVICRSAITRISKVEEFQGPKLFHRL